VSQLLQNGGCPADLPVDDTSDIGAVPTHPSPSLC
jgi:hypothetical protein